MSAINYSSDSDSDLLLHAPYIRVLSIIAWVLRTYRIYIARTIMMYSCSYVHYRVFFVIVVRT